MTTGLARGAESLVESYLGRYGMFPPADSAAHRRYDEMTGTTGNMLPGWAEIAGALDSIGATGLSGLTGLVDRLLEDDGVTYTPVNAGWQASAEPAAGAVRAQRWQLDPVPLLVDAGDWGRLEAGLLQRSQLMDALLTDIYSARSVLTGGLLPPELIFEHEDYLRQAHGITIPGSHQLFFHAVDVCRGPDGAFQALGDRTQAPSGAGYAMADRRVVSRVLPELFRRSAPRGLGNFFHSILGSLQAVAPTGAENPRIVVLSPGTHSETAFDQAFLASMLGLPLVESADLTVRGGRLLMRALGRYEPVDVVLRRVDAAWSDPLELRSESQLGVVGLTEACRRGTVTVVNSLGSGVLENPGLLPYLPVLSRELLGEELRLQSVPTFWCGSDIGRSHVLAHFDEMVLRPTGPGPSVTPALMSSADREKWRRRILARPTRWVGQQQAAFSEAPAIGVDGLAAQRVGMRVFTVAQQSGYLAMPGGLGRLISDAAVPGSITVRSGHSAAPSVAKDIWVRSVRADPSASTELVSVLDSGPLVEPVEMAAAASPRVLEDLFWLGRYAERTEDLTRLLIIARGLADTFRFRPYDVGAGSVPVLLSAVAAVSAAYPALPPWVDPADRMRQLVLDASTPGTVAQSLAGLQETARAVRDQLSGDTWMVLAGVDRAIAELAAATDDTGAVLQSTHAAILCGMLALSGLASENMVRDPGWRLMDLGRRLERGQQLAALLRATLATAHPADVETIVIESVLAVAESGLTYRRRYRGHTQVGTVLELLLLDAGNPRSLAYQVNAIAEDLRMLPDASGTSRPERLTEELAITLRRARPARMDDIDAGGDRPELAAFLGDVHDALRHLADAVATSHFWRSRPMLPLGQHVRGGATL
ncbi:circularly permuted type 2 ATP-grasp protein [Nakamurella sp. PAMC28650]|uniref:circularly permuted type 2 ATP-grasp protein n=1 Tax=Nakamurella sp. PAMC28650 TaxID=2762325 RepID=UPI00164D8707|nr:circularly permuted type 2 ATP-grasp protein [Nakamurella sp. PAMC28650]QNK79571.1 circularly permuted type 2 ATP-grasp protein [Nakamurella sp. PAMC28650]